VLHILPIHYLQVLSKDIQVYVTSSSVVEQSSQEVNSSVFPSRTVLSLQGYKVKLLYFLFRNAQADIPFYTVVMQNDLEITES